MLRARVKTQCQSASSCKQTGGGKTYWSQSRPIIGNSSLEDYQWTRNPKQSDPGLVVPGIVTRAETERRRSGPITKKPT